MKRLFTIVLLAAITASVQAGSGTVTFNNRITGQVDAPVKETDNSTFLNGTNYRAMLYAGPAGTAETALTAVGSYMTFRTDGGSGYFLTSSDPAGTGRTITGLSEDGGMATVQVRAWKVSTGETWELASTRGASPLLNVDTANPTPPAEPNANLVGLQGFSLVAVPEPTTIGLSVMGLGALLMRRRKAKA